MATNSYKINDAPSVGFTESQHTIDLFGEQGVVAGCKEYPIPLLNKVSVTAVSENGLLSKTRSVYVGYKTVNQLSGYIISGDSYIHGVSLLSNIISTGIVGIYEPGHFNEERPWSIFRMKEEEVKSLLNLGSGMGICIKIDYVSNNTSMVEYVKLNIDNVTIRINQDQSVPRYDELGIGTQLVSGETVPYGNVPEYSRRDFYYFTLSRETMNINLSSFITNPDSDSNLTLTLMAFVGETPSVSNTFNIYPKSSSDNVSITVPVQTYNAVIHVDNKDAPNNPDSYTDGYGFVADYDSASDLDTSIDITIENPV